jgi:hypothetical protein
VGGVGYCAKDRRHSPLNGSEQRSCWTSSVADAAEGFFALPAETAGALERGLLEVLPSHGVHPTVSER